MVLKRLMTMLLLKLVLYLIVAKVDYIVVVKIDNVSRSVAEFENLMMLFSWLIMSLWKMYK